MHLQFSSMFLLCYMSCSEMDECVLWSSKSLLRQIIYWSQSIILFIFFFLSTINWAKGDSNLNSCNNTKLRDFWILQNILRHLHYVYYRLNNFGMNTKYKWWNFNNKKIEKAIVCVIFFFKVQLFVENDLGKSKVSLYAYILVALFQVTHKSCFV